MIVVLIIQAFIPDGVDPDSPCFSTIMAVLPGLFAIGFHQRYMFYPSLRFCNLIGDLLPYR